MNGTYDGEDNFNFCRGDGLQKHFSCGKIFGEILETKIYFFLFLSRDGMGIIEKAKEIFEIIEGKQDIFMIAHADADGVAGASIFKMMLDEMGIDYQIKFVNYLDEEILEEHRDYTLLLVDVGNGNLKEIKKMDLDAIVIDHHMSYEFFKNSLNRKFME